MRFQMIMDKMIAIQSVNACARIAPFSPNRAFSRYRSGISNSPCLKIDKMVAEKAFPVDCRQFIFANKIPMNGPDNI